MKAQILLEGGPYDMNLISYGSNKGTFPDELRVASKNSDASGVRSEGWPPLPPPQPESVEVAVYRRTDVSEMPASLMWYGLYRFSGIRDSAPSLVQVWI